MAAGGDGLRIARWRGAFPPGYRDANEPETAIKDIAEIEALGEGDAVGVEFLKGTERCAAGTALPPLSSVAMP